MSSVEQPVIGALPRSTPGVIGRGALVFAAGMAMAAASFLVEQLVIRTVKNRA